MPTKRRSLSRSAKKGVDYSSQFSRTHLMRKSTAAQSTPRLLRDSMSSAKTLEFSSDDSSDGSGSDDVNETRKEELVDSVEVEDIEDPEVDDIGDRMHEELTFQDDEEDSFDGGALSKRQKSSSVKFGGRQKMAMGNLQHGMRGFAGLQRIKAALHASAIPARLPCRDQEADMIRRWLADSLREHRGQALYVSGCPGTGKTTTLLSVVKELQETAKCKQSIGFRFAYVNAMEFADPRRIFVEIYKQTLTINEKQTTRSVAPKTARDKLNQAFSIRDQSRPPIVIVVDEMDILSNRKYDILYDIFNWTAWAAAEVSVIGIANTLDLPERLPARITSRLGSHRVIFQPYTHEEIEEIVLGRLNSVEGIDDCVSEDAIKLAARKVANLSGDLRKALDILRNSIDRAIREGSKRLAIEHVNATIQAMREQPLYVFVRGLAQHSRLLFSAAVIFFERNDAKSVSWPRLYADYELLAMDAKTTPNDPSSSLALVASMLSSKLLVLATPDPGNPYERRYALEMPTYEARLTLNATAEDMREEEEKRAKEKKKKPFWFGVSVTN